MRSMKQAGGLALPAMGLGTWRMGESPARRGEELAALKAAIAQGITLFDTAEIYGDGAAETLLGEAVQGERERLLLVSKVAPSHASKAGTIRACEASLKRLGTDYLDLYLLHWIGSVPVEETIEAFAALRAHGKIRAWGVSNFDLEDMRGLPEGCAANQVLYNPQSRGIEFDLLPWCQARGIPVMAYTPLGQHNKVLENAAVKAVAAAHGATPGQVALAWGLRQEGVVSIPKTGHAARIEENLGALKLQLTPEDLAAIDRAFAPPKRAVPLAML